MKQISTLLLLLLLLPALGFGQDAEQAYRAGLSFAQAGRYQEAIGRYRDAVRLDSTHWQAYQALGDAYLKVGMNSDALDAYTRSLRINPANTQLDQSIQPLRQAEVLRSIRTNLPGDDPGGVQGYRYKTWIKHGVIFNFLGYSGLTGTGAAGTSGAYSASGRYFVTYGWKEWLAFQAELSLIGKGGVFHVQDPVTGLKASTVLSNFYFQVPILVKHYFTADSAVMFGPAVNFLVSSSVGKFAAQDAKSMVVSGVLGVQTKVSRHVFLDLRADYELSSAFQGPDIKTWALSGGLGYFFI